MSPAKSLTWIHLSDLHFGHGKEATPRFDQKLVTAAIIRDAELVASELGPPDVVFLTGDIAFSASADKEYPAASEWIGKLLEALKIGPERVLLVPGNHDVDRKKALEGHGRLAHKGLRADPDEVNGLLEKADEMEAIWPKLAAYQKFASAFGSPEITPARPFWRKRLSSDLGPVDVIGLNTALLSYDGSDSRENLALGIGQLQRALAGPKDDTLLLVLQHHPPGWLRDGNKLLAILKDWPHVLLCGHVHDQHGFVTLPLASRGNVELVAGAGHQDAHEAGEHAYAWGRLTRDGLAYYPRGWHEQEMRFLHQRICPPEDQKDYTPKLGEFARFLRAKLPDALASWLMKSAAYSPVLSNFDSVTGPAAFRTTAQIPVLGAAPAGVVVAAFNPMNPYFSVPYRAKGKQVIGRADALLKVREQLEKGQPTAIGQTVSFVGLGGLGKSQLAVEYAHAYKDNYSQGVFWFHADADLDAQLTRLAVAAQWVSQASEPKAMLEIAKHQIRTRSDCLIVFDNVEDRAAIEALLPESSATPHLLITSRVSQVGFYPVPIDRLLDEQSIELLCTESRRELEKPGEREAALRIAMQLEGLPLALELAGAYLGRFRHVSWTSYADLLEREGVKAHGLGDGPLASFTKHNANLYATLHIEEAILAGSPLLRGALDLLAWSGSTSMGKELLAFLLGGDSALLDVALGEAETLRILKREQGAPDQSNPRFHMHRLVREVRQAEIPLDHEPARWIEVLARLGSWFEERRDNFVDRPSYEAELDHLEVWQKHAARMGNVREAARLLWLCAYPHYNRGQFRRAQDMAQRALDLFDEAGIADSRLEAHLCDGVGGTLRALGEHQKALSYAQKALNIRREELGEEHSETARSLGFVGSLFGELGDYQAELDYQQRALTIHLKVNGERDPFAIVSVGNVGLAFGKLGEHQRAYEYTQRALDISREILGKVHPTTATLLHNVGSMFSELGEHKKALEVMMEAVGVQREIVGEKHPAVANSLNNIGSVFGKLKDHGAALDFKQRALDIRRDVLGEKHPDTARSLVNVGYSSVNLGKLVDGLGCVRMGFALLQETLGVGHPEAMLACESIVRFLLRQGKKTDALVLVEDNLQKVPHSPTLRRLKNEILGKRATKGPNRRPASAKKAKSPR